MQPHTCSQDLHEQWGCLNATETPRWKMLCLACLGEGVIVGNDCKRCKGMGEIAQDRCPNSTITKAGSFYFKTYTSFKNHGFLPSSGGYFDQSAKFINVVDFCETIASILRERKEKQRQVMENLKRKARNAKQQ